MKRFIPLVFTLAALLGACATYPDTMAQRMASLPQHYSQFDLQLGWQTTVADGRTRVEGVAKNVRYFVMYDLEIWVALLDRKGDVVARSVSFVIPSELGLDRSADFNLKLPVAASPGDRLRFTYKYKGSDGGDGARGGLSRTDWMQSFETVVPPQ